MGLFDKLKNNKVITPEERRIKNNKFIKEMKIACNENLPMIEDSSDTKLKDIDVICKRAIACLLTIQLACDIGENHDYEESRDLFSKLLKKFDAFDYLLENEKRLFDGKYSPQDVINVSWSYECYWSLVWALGLITDKEMKIPSDICNCQKASLLVGECKSFEEFESKTKLRDIEDILDMIDLYYRYHWVCVEKRINKDTNIGPLNGEVVMERRKGLEWLISDLDDWNEISLDT